MDKKSLTEEDIKLRFITPAIVEKAGWQKELIKMEYYFTDGRVIFQGNVYARKQGKKADYLLHYSANNPIAIVEAKDNNKAVGAGLQQAMDYAKILDIPFAYSSNGDGFIEHDFLTGKETNINMDEFPTPDELLKRLRDSKKYTSEEIKAIEEPYYWDAHTNIPRYYQRIAINRTIEAVARGQNRILLVMATGTGKTFTAFQIIHRLTKSGLKRRVLYLADRNVLIDQTMAQDFKPFKKVMTKIQKKNMDSSFEIYMALYQQLVSYDENIPDPFKEFKSTFFDLILVDECHRGSAKDESEWRKVLEYFSSATQIGMTATPKVKEGANNLDYFNEPLYTYSLKQGIEDGFLAPYRVTNSFLNIDLEGWTPEEDELDIKGNLIKAGFYNRKTFGRELVIMQRRDIVARRITKMLHRIGRMTKSIIFCADIEEAEAMRQLLVNYNSDLCKKDSRYIMRITGDENIGKKQLDNFIDPDQPYPTLVTTSEMLSTGVDCKTCGLIVIDKEIGSMTEFKQIVGRGTRLRTDKGKWHFEILDFRNVTQLFKDPEFDGDPELEGGGSKAYPPYRPRRTVSHDQPPREYGRKKYYINGKDIQINTEIVSYLGTDGHTLVTESLTDFTRKNIRGKYATLDEFIKNWTAADKKKVIVDELKEYNVLFDAVREKRPDLLNADIFDIICHVAFDKQPLTRKERANNVKKRDYLSRYEGVAKQVLEALLDKYANKGILEFENEDILDTPPFNTIGKPQKIVKLFGGWEKFEKALKDLENELYVA
ncbi:EcoAI/FtnUII family type I restriction enzme subunit R [Bacteroides ovatus]|uniref:EcoAI/FtnUII family type I restriction enzme subunit R n=1 Tax=Bacteroides ovatus TaxID=28116 RepID=UPI001F33C293|nr:DEAD/DEAH box helicase family protein [Bacteroides ovatus]MCE9172824.1 DEAD/DEAH box helicase family protein [Bacteroides ovatus]